MEKAGWDGYIPKIIWKNGGGDNLFALCNPDFIPDKILGGYVPQTGDLVEVEFDYKGKFLSVKFLEEAA